MTDPDPQTPPPPPIDHDLPICRVPSGRVYLCKLQFLRGYCILRAEPEAGSINALDPARQAQFLADMVRVGDALLEVTGAYRINYALMSNTDPVLHAHIVPRYMSEPEDLRRQPPWFYPTIDEPANRIDAERDRGLMRRIEQAIHPSTTKFNVRSGT